MTSRAGDEDDDDGDDPKQTFLSMWELTIVYS